MAYFSNSSEGEVFYEQCACCKWGEKPCPIAAVQLEYNYDAANNKVATAILNSLVFPDGTCAMLKTFHDDLALPEDDKDQMKLFS